MHLSAHLLGLTTFPLGFPVPRDRAPEPRGAPEICSCCCCCGARPLPFRLFFGRFFSWVVCMLISGARGCADSLEMGVGTVTVGGSMVANWPIPSRMTSG